MKYNGEKMKDFDHFKKTFNKLHGKPPLPPARLFGVLPGSEKEKRLLELLEEIERNCPCGARPETPNTHPHVSGCPVSEAIRLLVTPNREITNPQPDSTNANG